MPVYEYECQNCEKITEVIRSMRDADSPQRCEHCGSTKTKRAKSLVASTLGGAGEHVHTGPGCGKCGDPRGSCGM